VGEATQQLVAAKMMDDCFAHHRAEAGHSIRQPLWHLRLRRKIGVSSSPFHWSHSWNMWSIDLRSAPIETPVGLHGLDDHHLGKVLTRE
jgi:hypothetical protein